MCLNRKFLVISLIVYAIFQFYQAGSSFYTVFVAYEHGLNIKFLAICHVVVFTTSSVLLLIGATKSKPNLLIGALIFLFYKVGFIVWHFEKFYDLTFGCVDNGDDSSCDPNRLYIVYKHFFVSAFLFTTIVQTIILATVLKKKCRSAKAQRLEEGHYSNRAQLTEMSDTKEFDYSLVD